MLSDESEGAFLTLHEFVKAARKKLNANVWDYLVGGTETETTLRRNRMALDSLALRPRVLRDVSAIDASGRFLGRQVRLPVALAPVGSLESMEPGGAGAAAEAAAAFGVPIILSSVTPPEIQARVAASAAPKVFQLYVRGDDAWIEEQVRRAEAMGFDAFCLTVDTAVYSRRERDIAKRFAKPWRQRVEGIRHQAALSWDDVKRYKDRHPAFPLILKGIGTGEDAALAVGHGVDVVYVSNHGGRQLDHGRGAIEVLPEVVAAVEGRARIWIDGGFSRGTDVVKAMAMGAEMVGIGRLYCYALAAAGAEGVERMLVLLEDEIRAALGLLGAESLAALGASHLHPAQPTCAPHVLSAFPLLNLEDKGY
jgi:glycolate oxidase